MMQSRSLYQKPLLEDWVSWIKRATHIADEELQKANVTDWVREQRSRYWDFAGRIASCKDSRRSHAILNWIPEGGFRNVGSPRKRWKDDISAFCSSTSEEYCSEWFVLAQDAETWNSFKDNFIQWSAL